MTAPDGGVETLHIRCGSDLRQTLITAGFVGDYLEYANPLCQGPVLPNADWLDARVAFVVRAYGVSADGLRAAETALHTAASRYERVVMWFEHDHYDQLILARCLDAFTDAPPAVLELISIADYPVEGRFIGLGQLGAEAMPVLWSRRVPVTPAALRAGRAVWQALRQPDPTVLASMDPPDPPHLAGAVRRHCQELPGLGGGLSLTQRLILAMLNEEPMRIGMIFHRLTQEREPLPWLGDTMLRAIIEDMRCVRESVFTGVVDDGEARWWRETLTITPLGRRVLGGEVDYMSLRPPERWVGGVCIGGNAPGWRWDDRSGFAVLV